MVEKKKHGSTFLANHQDCQEEAIVTLLLNIPELLLPAEFKPHSPTSSNLVPCRNSQPVQSGKIEIYILRHWGKLTRYLLILEIVQCLFKRRDKVGGSRDSGNVGEGCHNNNTKNKENQFLSPLFLVGKKDGDPSFYQSQRVEQIDSLCSIENGRTFSVERIADAWIFNV